MLKNSSWRWALLALVVLGALLLRAHDVSRVFLWLDETDLFNEHVYRHPPTPLIQFAWNIKETQTNTWGWPAIIWTACQIFGGTAGVARMPSVLFGTAAVLLVFLVVYRVLPLEVRGSRFVPALIAAILTAVAMPQVEFSQRAYAYGAMPCLAAALLLAHLEVLRAMPGGQAPRRTFYRAVALYTAVASLALCIHPSFALMPLASLALLGLRAWRDFPRWTAGERRSVFRSAAVAGAVLFCAALANAKNPKYGYRPYLARYYHSPLTPHSIVKLLQHAYDLAAYHLNLFYNTSLYWPERANAVLLPLIVFCALGWVLAMRGRFGAGARHLAWLGVAAIALPAVISLIGNFPFGGVRQTLFLSPFLLIFTALGLYSLRARLATRILAVALACGYAGLWGANLPRFYEERLAPYSGDDIVQAWRQNGEAPVYARGCEREVRYNIRAHPEIGIHTLPTTAQPPYLLVSTHYRIDDKVCFPGYLDYLHQAGYKVSVVTERLPKHPESLQYSGSLYFPPNGLWIYKITNQ